MTSSGGFNELAKRQALCGMKTFRQLRDDPNFKRLRSQGLFSFIWWLSLVTLVIVAMIIPFLAWSLVWTLLWSVGTGISRLVPTRRHAPR